jgi:hypothetical protein
MPNCDFYAIPSDHEQLLDWLFNEDTCDVYELGSDSEKPLKQFQNASEVLAQFDRKFSTGKKWTHVHLQLYVRGAGPLFVPRRIELDPRACGGAKFRYAAEGWGLVQLYLGTATRDDVKESHTNHNTQRGLEAWATQSSHLQEIERWDFKKITAFSSRLNRQIKKMGAAKLGSRPILPGALKLWQEGHALFPFIRDCCEVKLRSDL